MVLAAPLPLGGVDTFHLQADREMRRHGLAGNVCALVAELDGHVDEARFAKRLRRGVELLTPLSWRLGRGKHWLPAWRLERGKRPPELSRRHLGPGPVLPQVLSNLSRTLDGRAPWNVELWRGETRDVVLLRWFHPFCDARGATRLLAWLAADVDDADLEAPPLDKSYRTADRLIAKLEADERNALSKAYNDHIWALSRRPIASLHGPRRRPLGSLIASRVTLDVQATRAFDATLKARAGLSDTSLIAFAATRALDRMLSDRGTSPPHYCMPMPLSLDPKREKTRMFGNHLTMMMMSLDRPALLDEAAAVASLADQRRAIVRGKLDRGMVAALDRARYLPPTLFNWISRLPFGGERTSLVVSNPGEVALDAVLGVPVRDAFTLPSVMALPGFQVIGGRHAGRLSLLAMSYDGLTTQGELSERAEGMKALLLSGV